MKLGKLSLVAVMALGTSAFAIDNVKVNGEAKLIYQTSDVQKYAGETADTGLFKQGNGAVGAGAPYGGAAAGGTSLTLGATADLLQNISAGAEVQAFSTLGLENNLVQDTMAPGGATRAEDSSTMSQLWLAASMGKTIVKVGRMELDTPLAFTETWNIVKNTFEGAVVLNNDIPDTTLVAAWVGKHNGYNDSAETATAVNNKFPGYFAAGESLGVNLLMGSTGRTVDMENFRTFGTDGAYAFAAVNKSIPNTTLQAWYYDVVKVADAFWLQADTKVAGMVSLGAQYAQLDPKSNVDDLAVAGFGAKPDESNIWAVKAAVDVSSVNVYAAYSQADEDGLLGFANVATGDKTSIYTGLGSIYMDSVVTTPGAKAWKVGASTKMIPGVTLAASYCEANDLFDVNNNDISAWDVSASGKVGPLGLTAIYTDVNNDTVAAAGNLGLIQPAMYAGRDIESIRLIASLKF